MCLLYRIDVFCFFFFFSSRRRHTRFDCDWSSDVCSSDLPFEGMGLRREEMRVAKRVVFALLIALALFHIMGCVSGASVQRTTKDFARSEERRVGKECRSRWSPYH